MAAAAASLLLVSGVGVITIVYLFASFIEGRLEERRERVTRGE